MFTIYCTALTEAVKSLIVTHYKITFIILQRSKYFLQSNTTVSRQSAPQVSEHHGEVYHLYNSASKNKHRITEKPRSNCIGFVVGSVQVSKALLYQGKLAMPTYSICAFGNK